jgi:hypothetical protein
LGRQDGRGKRDGGHTRLINIILTLLYLTWIEKPAHTRLLSHSTMAFRQDNQFVARDIVFLDCLANNLLAYSVRIYICRIPCVQSLVEGGFEEGERL